MNKFNYGDAVEYGDKTVYFIHNNNDVAYCWTEFTVDTVSGEILLIKMDELSVTFTQLEDVDLTHLRNLAKEYIKDRTSGDGEPDDDYDHWFLENALEALYGYDIFDRLRKY